MAQLSAETIAKYEAHFLKTKNREHRYQVKTRLMLQKAAKAGIKVTEAEIDAAIKAKG